MSLMVYLAEKESVAKAIAEAKGFNTSKKTEDGFFYSEEDEIIIAYTNGHLLAVKEPHEIDTEYKEWRLDMLPIKYKANREYLTIINSKRYLYRKVSKQLKLAKSIILAGDAGREGELIQRWLLSKINLNDKYVARMWMQSLTKEAIIKAEENLYILNVPEQESIVNGYKDKVKTFNNLYAAGEARAFMDAILGFNYSRALSLAKTNGVTVIYGRCKSPLTHEIIKRDKEIANFIQEPFSYIEASINNNESCKLMLIDDNKDRIVYKERCDAEKIIAAIPKKVVVESVFKKETVRHPNKPYDILTLQKEMAKRYDFTADKTLSICQELYDKYKILSYPRTDSRYFTHDLYDELKNVTKYLCFDRFEKAAVLASLANIPKRYINDKKVGDHHALMPVGDKDIKEQYNLLSDDEQKVFDAICENFISLFLPDYVYDEIEIIATAEKYKFILKGKIIKDEGYSSYFTENEDENITQEINNIEEGMILDIEPIIVDSVTKPKSHYTTESLLNLMKIYNIGTGATRDSIIKELVTPRGTNKESYIIKDGRYYISTEFGQKIDDLIPEDIKTVEYLSFLDNKIKEIEDGVLDKDLFLNELQNELDNNIIKLKSTADINKLTYKSKTELKLKCPCCGGTLVEKRDFYGCENYSREKKCDFTISKSFRGKKLSEKSIELLLTKGKTGKFKFKSERGINYEAHIVLKNKDGKYGLEAEF